MKKILFAAFAAFVACTGLAAKSVTLYYGDGDTLEPEDSVMFSLDDFPEEINGYPVLDEYLPNGVELTWTGKKFKAPKKGKVKYSKSEEVVHGEVQRLSGGDDQRHYKEIHRCGGQH